MDSLHTHPLTQRELPIIDEMIIDDSTAVHHRPITPYQVLRMLPSDATPEQQDSAIQAWFQPGEVHYSQQPDTLHLPGHGPGRNPTDVSLPQYYTQNYFSGDTLLHPEITGGRLGVAGDPIPYTIRGDNMFTALFLLCIIVLVVSVANAKHFIAKQLKDFFFISHSNDQITETSSEFRFQFFLVLLNCVLLSMAMYLYITDSVADTFTLSSDYTEIGLLFASIVGYFSLKWIAYCIVNTTFFGGNKNLQFFKAQLFITATESVLLFPAVLLQIYFDLSVQNSIYYYVGVVFLVKILTFYKSWVIFFKQNGVFMQIFLYFCALEIAPLLGYTAALLLMVDVLKINF